VNPEHTPGSFGPVKVLENGIALRVIAGGLLQMVISFFTGESCKTALGSRSTCPLAAYRHHRR